MTESKHCPPNAGQCCYEQHRLDASKADIGRLMIFLGIQKTFYTCAAISPDLVVTDAA